MNSVETTFPKLLRDNTRRYGKRVAMREKAKGIWQEISWETYLKKVKRLSLGLLEMGLKKGEHASILAENCPEWLYADLSIQSVRSISVGIYPTNSPEQVQYILDHSQSRIVFVKDQEQADKVLEIKGELPMLRKMVVMDMKGLRHYGDPLIVSYQDVEDLGRKADEKDPEAFDRMVQQTEP